MVHDLSALTAVELKMLQAMARCATLVEAASLVHRSPKTMSSQKERIRLKLGIPPSRAEWTALLVQVRGEDLKDFQATNPFAASPEIWMSYVGACALLSRLQRLVTDGEEQAIVEQAISDCAMLSNGKLRVIRVSNGVALEPADARLDEPVVSMRTLYEDAT